MVKSGTTSRRERRPPDEKNHGVCGRYKGVRMRKSGRWVAEVRRPNSRSRIWLGSYDTPQEAARAYDAAVFCLRGPSALLNFPANPPEIPSGRDLSPSGIQEAACRHAHKFPAEADDATPEIPEEMKCPAEHQEGYSLAMVAVRVHDGDDGLTCNAHHYQSSRLWTF